MNKQDITRLRELAKKYKEISSLDEQKQKQKLWYSLNNRTPIRPAVILGDIPWHKMNVNDELTLTCEDPFARQLENQIRQTIYRWNHMAGDMIVRDYINLPIPIVGCDYGIDQKFEAKGTDEKNNIVGKKYIDQLQSEKDLEKITFNEIKVDRERYDRVADIYDRIFSGILEVRHVGKHINFNAWDKLESWHGVENCLFDMVDRPEFLHMIMRRITDVTHHMIDSLERLKLVRQHQDTIMFAPADIDWNMNEKGSEGSARNSWVFGTAQIFSSVSKEMHEEFELPYAQEIFSRFGNGYYGCCEPLHNRIDMVEKIPNVRKISISPFADSVVAAQNIGDKYIMSNKPNPAYVAVDNVNWDIVETDLRKTIKACRDNNTPVEFILKDLSTVKYHPEHLWNWIERAEHIVCE